MTTLGSWSSGTLPTVVGGAVSENMTEGIRPSSIQIAQTASSPAAVKWEYGSPVTQAAYRFYFKTPSAWPSASFPLLWASTISGDVQSFRVDLAGSGAPGQLRFRRGSTNTQIAASANNTLALSTWYRVEVLVTENGTSGNGRVVLYTGDSTAALWDTGTLSGDFGPSHNRVALGNWISTVTVGTFYLDDIMLTDGTTLIGPAGTPTAGPKITIWNGTAEVSAHVAVWNGTAEVTATLELH